MSPFCRSCLAVARDHEIRCPRDNEFYTRRQCSGCQAELFPRELYCAQCGLEVESPDEHILLPPAAPWLSLLSSAALDTTSIVLVVALALGLSPWIAVPAGLLLAVVYRTLGRAGGRQTFGQAVFHLVSVGEDAGPLSLPSAAKRTLLELVLAPLALVRSRQASELLERKSAAFEVKLV